MMQWRFDAEVNEEAEDEKEKKIYKRGVSKLKILVPRT